MCNECCLSRIEEFRISKDLICSPFFEQIELRKLLCFEYWGSTRTIVLLLFTLVILFVVKLIYVCLLPLRHQISIFIESPLEDLVPYDLEE